MVREDCTELTSPFHEAPWITVAHLTRTPRSEQPGLHQGDHGEWKSMLEDPACNDKVAFDEALHSAIDPQLLSGRLSLPRAAASGEFAVEQTDVAPTEKPMHGADDEDGGNRGAANRGLQCHAESTWRGQAPGKLSK